jgi:hypothetical protein
LILIGLVKWDLSKSTPDGYGNRNNWSCLHPSTPNAAIAVGVGANTIECRAIPDDARVLSSDLIPLIDFLVGLSESR